MSAFPYLNTKHDVGDFFSVPFPLPTVVLGIGCLVLNRVLLLRKPYRWLDGARERDDQNFSDRDADFSRTMFRISTAICWVVLVATIVMLGNERRWSMPSLDSETNTKLDGLYSDGLHLGSLAFRKFDLADVADERRSRK